MAMFTSIAAGIGLAATAASTAMSFAQAAEQNSIKNKAEAEAEKALAEAKKRLDVNVYESLDVNLDAFRRQQEGLLSAAAQATAAGVESERGVAATAGRVQAGVNDAMAGIREAEVSKLEELERLTAGEESRLKDIGAQINLDEAAGAQAAAANAAEMEQMALAQGMEGVVSAVGQAAEMAPLFSKTKGARQASRLERQFEKGQRKGVGNVEYKGKDFVGSTIDAAIAQGISVPQKLDDFRALQRGGVEFQDWLSQRNPDEFNTIMSKLGLSAPKFR
jgi:hypothetical protein